MRNPVTIGGPRNPVTIRGTRNPITFRGTKNPVTIGGTRNPVTIMGLDPEAELYFARAGVTDPTARIQINNCITQLKAHGFYSSLTGFWIGRSAYNAGTGTTVYDLTSNTLNGTMVNGPSWSHDGIVFSGTTQAVTTGRTQTMNGSWSAFVVGRQTATSAPNNRRFLGSNPNNTLLYQNGSNVAACNLGMYDGTTVAVTTLTTDVSSLKMLGATYSVANRQAFYVSGSLFQARNVAMVAGSHVVQLGSSEPGGQGMLAGLISVAMIFGATELTASQVAALYNILKATICADQLLP